MADNVFRVEVGAQIAISTQKLKEDIQNILNDISKTPPTVTVGLAKTSSKRQIDADLNELFKDTGKTQYGITLGLKGGGNIRGSTGKAITKDLLAISSTLSQQQAAKVTMHIDTAASQKAMLAELKKLDLGVAITANNQQTPQQQQQSKDRTAYNAALKEGVRLRAEELTLRRQAESLDKTSQKWTETNRQANAKEAAYNKVRKDYLQTDGAKRLGHTDAFWDKEVREAARVENAYNAVQRAAAGARDELAATQTNEAKALFDKVTTLQVEINRAKAAQVKSTQNDPEWQAQQGIINRKQAEYNTLLQKASDPAAFQAQVDGNEKVKASLDQLVVAQGKVAKAAQSSQTKVDAARKKADASIDSQIDAAKAKLNNGSSDGLEYVQRFETLRKELKDAGASATVAGQEIRKLSREAKDAGAMAETAGEKFSRMLGTKVGYAAITLLLAQVRNGLRQIYTNVVEIDTGMTELKKVTDETDQVYSKFLDNAAVRAKQLGATISDTVNATASFARLGYSLDEAAQLADAAVVYNHVGDEIESIDDASNSVISTMQAFGIEAENVMSIVDKFNTIGKQNCPAA